MSYTERYCHRCLYWNWKGKGFDGECEVSVNCTTSIGNHQLPGRFVELTEEVLKRTVKRSN